MKKELLVASKTLFVPVWKCKEESLVHFTINNSLIYEFWIPFRERNSLTQPDYYAPLDFTKYFSKDNKQKVTLELVSSSVDFNPPVSTPDETVLDFFTFDSNKIENNNFKKSAIENSDITFLKKELPKDSQNSSQKQNTNRPIIHFTPNTGWMNDPNGLVFYNGIYHLYFQYNPFNIKWQNMCWGHAESKDLLHWTQCKTVLYPDEQGTIFSGSGIVNKKALLGQKKDSLLFFYTAAGGAGNVLQSKGKLSTQRVAVSNDEGKTLQKLERGVIPTIEKENRDPKVFYHKQSHSYICVLWLEETTYCILRSADLENWKETQRFNFTGAWECPDLVELNCIDSNGNATEKKWLFWSADGFYLVGDFDGYTFTPTDKDFTKHKNAYCNKFAYAAQTYSNIKDRTVSIPWLRTKNEGCNYCGVMGLPREFSLLKTKNDNYTLVQKPIKEYLLQKKLYKEITSSNTVLDLDVQTYEIEIDSSEFNFTVGKTSIQYKSKKIFFNDEEINFPNINQSEKIHILIDREIVEVWNESCTSVLYKELPYSENNNRICFQTKEKLSANIYYKE